MPTDVLTLYFAMSASGEGVLAPVMAFNLPLGGRDWNEFIFIVISKIYILGPLMKLYSVFNLKYWLN